MYGSHEQNKLKRNKEGEENPKANNNRRAQSNIEKHVINL